MQALQWCAEPQDERISLIGVDYVWHKTRDGGDLYLTRFGLPFRDHLLPENWLAPDWFTSQRTRLSGTSAIYKIPTRPVRGRSINVVARFSRVGEEAFVASSTGALYDHVEFNSPFEEFARVMELRAARTPRCPSRMLTKRPLAIYVPAERLQLWQTGRQESKIAAKSARHPEAAIDIHRQYILLYGWIDGMNAVETAEILGLTNQPLQSFLSAATHRAIRELELHGFCVFDIKPEHVLFRVRPDHSLLRRRDGAVAYAVVDYELLMRLEDGSRHP